jgi:hypothetical protein
MQTPHPPSQLDALRAMRATVATMSQAQIDAALYPVHGIVTGDHAWSREDLIRYYDDTIAQVVLRERNDTRSSQ